MATEKELENAIHLAVNLITNCIALGVAMGVSENRKMYDLALRSDQAKAVEVLKKQFIDLIKKGIQDGK